MNVEVSRSEKVAQIAALRAERARRRGEYPLSHAQLRLWLLDQADPGNPAYNVCRVFRLCGPLDALAFECSIGAILERHAPLRTTFHTVDGGPVQVVREAGTPALQFIDGEAWPPEDHAVETDRIVTDAATYRFDLSVDAMLKTILIRLASDEHVLIVTLHHIAIDERSLEILFAELQANYAAFSSRRTPLRMPLGMQYTDFALWERAQTASERVRSQLAYWSTALAGAPPAIALPYSASRAFQPRFAGASGRIALTREHVASVAAIARGAGATPFMTYLAAFSALLYHYCGSEDIVIGTPISGRSRRDVEETIGFFTNALPLRLDLSGNPTFFEIVRRVRSATLDAFTNRDAPFEHVVANVAKQRSATSNPIFQVMFAVQADAHSRFDLPGISVTPLEPPRAVAKFDLSALVFERGDDVTLELNYDTGSIDAATVAAMLNSFREIFDALSVSAQTSLVSVCPKPSPKTIDPNEHVPASAANAASAVIAASEAGAASAAGEAGAEREPAAESSAGDAGERGERRVLEAQLIELWETLLEARPICVKDDFFALGGHSLLVLQMVARIEDDYGVRLPLSVLFERATIEHIAHALVSRPSAPTQTQTPLHVLRRGPTQPPLIFFHGDFSGASFYLRTLAKHLGKRSVYALAPHGFDGGNVPESYEAMAADYLALLRHEGILPPYDLVGYCNGALVALEVGRLLARSGEPPPRVFAVEAEIGHRALERTTAIVAGAAGVLRLSERTQAMLVLRVMHRWKRIVRVTKLADVASLAAGELRSIVAKLRRSSPPPAELPDRRLARIYRERLMRYRPAPYAGPITVFSARDERRVHGYRNAGWSKISASANFQLVPGDHATCVTTEGPALASRLRKCLDA